MLYNTLCMRRKNKFPGNGLSRVAMIFQIATKAHHNLTIPELNRIKNINPKKLEDIYEMIIKDTMTSSDAKFALSLFFNQRNI